MKQTQEKVVFGEIKDETEVVRRTIEVFYDNNLIGHLISIKRTFTSDLDEFRFFSADESDEFDEFGKEVAINMDLGDEVGEALESFKSYYPDHAKEKIKEAIAAINASNGVKDNDQS